MKNQEGVKTGGMSRVKEKTKSSYHILVLHAKRHILNGRKEENVKKGAVCSEKRKKPLDPSGNKYPREDTSIGKKNKSGKEGRVIGVNQKGST